MHTCTVLELQDIPCLLSHETLLQVCKCCVTVCQHSLALALFAGVSHPPRPLSPTRLYLSLSHSITSPHTHTHTHTHTRSLTSSDHRRAVRPKLRQKASSAHLRLLRDREDVTTEMLTPSSDNSGLDSNSFSTYMGNGICLWEAVVARDSGSSVPYIYDARYHAHPYILSTVILLFPTLDSVLNEQNSLS